MSASNKKKLRKEKIDAVMTERQRDEQKEQKKLKAYSITFTVVMVAVLIAAIGIGTFSFLKRSGFMQRRTVAAVVDGKELNSIDMTYYFVDAITKQYNSWQQSFGENINLYTQMMGLDLTKPLNQQSNGDDSTWSDFFIDQAVQNAKSDAVLCKMAEAEGFTMPEADKKVLEETQKQMDEFIKAYGFESFDQYLKSYYGHGASEETYNAYVEKSTLATAYLRTYSDNLKYEQSQINDYGKEHYNEFSSYSYNHYYLPSSSYLKDGTKDEQGKEVFTDEQKAEALKAAEADAKSLLSAKSADELDKLIAALPVNKENPHAECARNKLQLYMEISENIRTWIADDSRKQGDITMIPNYNTTADEDGKETKELIGYIVVMFEGKDDNLESLDNVRHILVKFQSTQPAGSTAGYTDEEKAAAKEKAEKILAEWKNGQANEDSFGELATNKSDDDGTKALGGLIKNIHRGSNLVPSFLNWAIDDARKEGDTGIVESEYGYHVMYSCAPSQQTYRDFMIENTMHANDLDKWYESIMEPVSAEKKDVSYLPTSYVIQPAAQ